MSQLNLIYRRETTTKKCKTEKPKSKTDMLRSNSKSLGNHVASPEEKKERLQWERFAEKEGFKLAVSDARSAYVSALMLIHRLKVVYQ